NLKTGRVSQITIGSPLPLYKEAACSFDEHRFGYRGKTVTMEDKLPVKDLLEKAILFLDAPYLWGGRSIFGIDCSGFVQTVFKLCGYALPRDSAEQVHKGSLVDFFDEAIPGDVGFFDNEEGKIVHTGIVIEPGKIIHASGKV